MSIDVAGKTLSPHHMVTSSTRHNLAILLRIRGRKGEALELYETAIDGYVEVGPRADFRRANAFNGLGKVQRDLGLLDKSLESFRQCLKIRERILEPGHWRLGTAHSLLGETLGIAGHYDEAQRHLTKGLAILELVNGTDDSKTEEALERLKHFNQTIRPLSPALGVDQVTPADPPR